MNCDGESAALADPRLHRRKRQDGATLDEGFLLPSWCKHMPADGEAWQPGAWPLTPCQPDESLEVGLVLLTDSSSRLCLLFHATVEVG